jgi:hypothetical protein
LALTWFVYELTRARVRRGARVPRTVAVRAPAAGTPAQVDAIAIQLAALVGAIDRLVTRLDGAPPAPAPVEGPAVEAAPAAPASAAADVEAAFRGAAAPQTEPAEAATWVVDPAYPYDWPTEEQLDRFLERGRGADFDL